MEDNTFNERFRSRTKKFAVDVFLYLGTLSGIKNAQPIVYQLTKSSTSVAANWRAACRARSGNEFYSKVCIVVEEADESEFWLDFIAATKIDISPERQRLEKEAHEILLLTSTIKSRNTPKK
ncbi:MAG: four helix bundle protein [Saprospiraceae bacterium]|nr:four helix bundle protein [Saprospiraceae bacterium]